MFRILFALLLLTSPAFAITQWSVGIPLASDLKSNWPTVAQAQWQVIDNLLSNYRQGLYLTYASSSSLTVGAGSVTVSASGVQPRFFLLNASPITLTTANLDTGNSFAASTTYYVYAGTASTTASAAMGYISLSNTVPTGISYFYQLGSFTTDSNGNISQIVDNAVVAHLGAWSTATLGVTSQATTDLFLSCSMQSSGSGGMFSVADDTNPSPSISRTQCGNGSNSINTNGGCALFIGKGEYYRITASGPAVGTCYTRPFGQ